MKILLLKHVKKIGQEGEVVEVADGHANSFLIPRKLARVATAEDEKRIVQITSHREEKTQAKQELEMGIFKKSNKKHIQIQASTNAQGHLFAAISKSDITAHLPGVTPDHIVLKQPLKEVGEYDIPLHIGDNKGSILLSVTR